MFWKMSKILVALSIAIFCFGQQEDADDSSMRTRDLSGIFYQPKLEPKPAKTPSSKPATKPQPRKFHMGLKYQAILCSEQCDIQEVETTREFHSGERIRFTFEANTDGYLYVLHRGSSGEEGVLFPHPNINGGSNKVKARIRYPVPSDTWFRFDENPGEEFLRVILSRHPIERLEQAIGNQVNLQPAAAEQAPAPRKAQAQKSSIMLISASEQELNSRVRARDLALFTEESPVTSTRVSSTRVQSTLIVNTNPDEDQNELVYKDIVLKHTSEPAAANYGGMNARDLYLEGSQQPKQAGGTPAAVPLGLSYSVLKRQQNNEYKKVDPQGNFYARDDIRLRIEVNDSGYLYVVHRDPVGMWQPMFPSGDPSERSNAVKRNGRYEIPSAEDKYRWVFDSQPGIEKLYIVFARQRQPNFEALVQSIGHDKSPPAKQSPSIKQTVTAKSDNSGGSFIQFVNDDSLAMMSKMHERGIKKEIVYESESGTTAVPVAYVASPSVDSDALVITELNLEHK